MFLESEKNDIYFKRLVIRNEVVFVVYLLNLFVFI